MQRVLMDSIATEERFHQAYDEPQLLADHASNVGQHLGADSAYKVEVHCGYALCEYDAWGQSARWRPCFLSAIPSASTEPIFGRWCWQRDVDLLGVRQETVRIP